MKLLSFGLSILICGVLHASPQKLIQAVDLPIVIEGKTVGSMKLPAGSEVVVVSNDGTNAVIQRGWATYTIAASNLPALTFLPEPSTESSVASTQQSPTANSPPTPSTLKSMPIGKPLNESTIVPFFVPYGEHTPSAIDGTRINSEMPGSHGWLTIKNAHFYSGDKRIRFAGVNASWEEKDDEIAEMKKYGFNAVRLWINVGSKDKGELDPEKIRKFDEGIARFLKAGFWINLNCLSDGALAPHTLDKEKLETYKRFLSKFLSHVNPYTGKAYGNDAAIFAIEINNEQSFTRAVCNNDTYHRNGFDPNEIRPQILASWNEWLTQRYHDQNGLDAAWKNNTEKLGNVTDLIPYSWDKAKTLSRLEHKSEVAPSSENASPKKYALKEKIKDWAQWAQEMDMNCAKDFVSFIHNELHYPGFVMTGSMNVCMDTRNCGDVIFHHSYNTSPDPVCVSQNLKVGAHNVVVGKPNIFNEINEIGWNKHIAETALAAFFVASAQDWDGVFLFNWTHTFLEAIHENYFHAIKKDGPFVEDMIKGTCPVKDNPAVMVSFPTCINLFLRGDIAPLNEKRFSPWSGSDDGHEKYHDRRNTPFDVFDYRSGLIMPGNNPDANDDFGEQGSYQFDGNTMKLCSPKTVVAIGTETNSNIGDIRYELGKTQLGWSCLAVTSLSNDQPIKSASKLLVTLLGSTGNSNAGPMHSSDFPSKEAFKAAYLKAWGTGPVITECISANVFIPVDTSKGTFKAYSLDERAQRKEVIPLEVTPEGITLHTTGKEGTVWYEISRS